MMVIDTVVPYRAVTKPCVTNITPEVFPRRTWLLPVFSLVSDDLPEGTP